MQSQRGHQVLLEVVVQRPLPARRSLLASALTVRLQFGRGVFSEREGVFCGWEGARGEVLVSVVAGERAGHFCTACLLLLDLFLHWQ